MTDLEAMKARKSARTYFSSPIETRKVKTLQAMIDGFNQDESLQFVLIRDGAQQAFNNMEISYGMLTNVHAMIALTGTKNDNLVREKVGYYGEQLVLEAVKMGLGTCWIAATVDRRSPVFQVEPGKEIYCVLTMGYAASETQFKLDLLKKLIVSTKKSNWYTASEAPPVWFVSGIEGARLAPSSLSSQPVMFTYSPQQTTAYIEDEKSENWINLGIAKYHLQPWPAAPSPLATTASFTKTKPKKACPPRRTMPPGFAGFFWFFLLVCFCLIRFAWWIFPAFFILPILRIRSCLSFAAETSS